MLEINNLRMEYRSEHVSHLAVDDISLSVRPGEFFTLLGPSGCGKTTTLRSVAGLETPTGGAISINGEPVFSHDRALNVPTQKRDISMVFQSYAIWPHMSVFGNVAFPLQAAGMPSRQVRSKVDDVLSLVGLADYADRSATQLSGGQQQRVAVARAFVKEAAILLLDEPLSNLDAKLREQMRREMRHLQKRVGTTSIYVTHDQDEALSLSDRIAVIDGGNLIELGTPTELYLKPKSTFTASFIGQADLIECQVVGKAADGAKVRTPFGELIAGVHPHLAGSATHVLVRPECVELIDAATHDTNTFDGTITSVMFSGKSVEYHVRLANDFEITVQTPPIVLREAGASVRMHIPPERCVLLAGERRTGIEPRQTAVAA
ncbi:MAG: ABC transporter ATP-binding protein [Rhizobiaceae bacterium]|nr:ABC transporter ATP-binding protein [Rhizobiaceae bacterium]MCV0407257.1 ABC transporter ATP-binding protein [Rhizobiaceae bacterium]